MALLAAPGFWGSSKINARMLYWVLFSNLSSMRVWVRTGNHRRVLLKGVLQPAVPMTCRALCAAFQHTNLNSVLDYADYRSL